MRVVLLINHVLMVGFGVASGSFKALAGQADLEVFAHLGMGRWAIALFGAVQAAAALLTLPSRTRRLGTIGLTGSNLLASAGLFAAGVQPFGVISLLFVAMAALVWKRT